MNSITRNQVGSGALAVGAAAGGVAALVFTGTFLGRAWRIITNYGGVAAHNIPERWKSEECEFVSNHKVLAVAYVIFGLLGSLLSAAGFFLIAYSVGKSLLLGAAVSHWTPAIIAAVGGAVVSVAIDLLYTIENRQASALTYFFIFPKPLPEAEQYGLHGADYSDS